MKTWASASQVTNWILAATIEEVRYGCTDKVLELIAIVLASHDFPILIAVVGPT